MTVANEIKKYKFKDGLPVEFEIITISDLIGKHRNILSQPHRDNFYHIIWIKEGNPTHIVDFNPLKLESNSLLFIPKDCVHLFDSESEYEGKVILFTDDFFTFNPCDLRFLQSTILYNDLFDIAKVQINGTDETLLILLGLLEIEFQNSKSLYHHIALKNLLHNFLMVADRERRKQGFIDINANSDLETLLRFKNLLEKKFKTIKSVSKYAAELSVSERRLNKATTLVLDKTPKQLIDERVLLEARRLLAHSSLTIKEIGYELGFAEPTNFIKYFRKQTKKTPSESREQDHL